MTKLPPCHSRRELEPASERQFLCAHPRVHIQGNLVTPEICRMCQYWKEPPPRVFPPSTPPPHLWIDGPRSVAVVIPCHNYGRFLAECLESVLIQTHPAGEILVVDDASTDGTREIASGYSHAGVKYHRVEERNVHLVRAAGMRQTESHVLCFLDADDMLAPEYLELGLAHFADPSVGLVYSDMRQFGHRQRGIRRFPDTCDPAQLQRRNYMHAGSLVLRQALQMSGAFDVDVDPHITTADWFLWRRVLQRGWQARKQPGFYLYRQHADSSTRRLSHDICYFDEAQLAQEEVTLFIPLAGRAALWPQLATFLEQQVWPHDQTRLVLLDTSQDGTFSQTVRRWIATCDYDDVRHVRDAVGAPKLADAKRSVVGDAVRLAMAQIYNRLSQEAVTPYVWILEDDVLPPPDVCRHLLTGFDVQTASVAAPYCSRFHDGFVAWDRSGQSFRRRGLGLQTVGGNGFGCVMIRGDVLRQAVFTSVGDEHDFDHAFYTRLRSTGLAAKVDWSIECEHRSHRGELEQEPAVP